MNDSGITFKRRVASLLIKSLALTIVGATCSSAAADFVRPPDAPSWWTDPPGDTTRIHYRNLSSDPNLIRDDEYTMGFTSNTADEFTFQSQIQRGISAQGPVNPAWGDDVSTGIAPGTFRAKIGNAARRRNTKHYFVALVWKPVGGLLGDVTVDVSAPAGSAVTPNLNVKVGPDARGWNLSIFSGKIHPQPAWEEFKFTVPAGNAPNQGILANSLWIGTYCTPVPNPAGATVLAMGSLVAFRRRR